jgi:predicted nucleic acid-binding protein
MLFAKSCALMRNIADTGLLKGLLDRSDTHHRWAYEQFKTNAPFFTCECVLDELAFIVGDARLGMKMVARGDLVLDFCLADHIDQILELLEKYSIRPMDLADACVVRMTELTDRCKVWTVDNADFKVYRRHGRHVIPCEFPGC